MHGKKKLRNLQPKQQLSTGSRWVILFMYQMLFSKEKVNIYKLELKLPQIKLEE